MTKTPSIEDIEREIEEELADQGFDDLPTDPAAEIAKQQEEARKRAEEAAREAQKLAGRV